MKTCCCSLPVSCCQNCPNRNNDNINRGPYNPYYPGFPSWPGGTSPYPYAPLNPETPKLNDWPKPVKVITEEDYNALLERIKKLEAK